MCPTLCETTLKVTPLTYWPLCSCHRLYQQFFCPWMLVVVVHWKGMEVETNTKPQHHNEGAIEGGSKAVQTSYFKGVQDIYKNSQMTFKWFSYTYLWRIFTGYEINSSGTLTCQQNRGPVTGFKLPVLGYCPYLLKHQDSYHRNPFLSMFPSSIWYFIYLSIYVQ